MKSKLFIAVLGLCLIAAGGSPLFAARAKAHVAATQTTGKHKHKHHGHHKHHKKLTKAQKKAVHQAKKQQKKAAKV